MSAGIAASQYHSSFAILNSLVFGIWRFPL